MKRKFGLLLIILAVIALTSIVILEKRNEQQTKKIEESVNEVLPTGVKQTKQPLRISEMRKRDYPGSEITVEETLAKGVNYNRYIASYMSDGLKIYGLLTVPSTDKPEKGFPAIVFLHGYLAPQTYVTTERYVAYQDGFARAGYATFKPDLRGNGKSEGNSSVANFSPDYVTDVLNALASVQKMKEVNADKIGMWGHSMGGGLTLRSLVVSPKIKAAVVWAGVVGDYEDLINRYRARIPWLKAETRPPTYSAFLDFMDKHGSPSVNPEFWKEIDPYTYLSDISAPIQLHHSKTDESVPWEFSEHLERELKTKGKTVELFLYEGDNHNINGNFSVAMGRSVEFFDKYLK